MKELVSIIITTYKRPELLLRSLNSALNQTYENLEVIVVDDNDPDSPARKATEELIEKEFNDHDNLKYRKMPQNSGACAARNYGVEVCKGDFISFLDDDDEYLPEKTAHQMEVFAGDRENKLSAVGCYMEVVDGDGKFLYISRDDIKGDVFYYQMCDTVCCTLQLLIRKSVYVQSGGFETMHSSQEHWMLAKLFSVNPYYDYIPEVLCRAYHHEGARISNNKTRPLGVVELYNNCMKLLNQFTPEQAAIIQRRRNDHIITAYLHAGMKKESLYYWRRGIKMRRKLGANDFYTFYVIIIGEKAHNKIISYLSKIKHLFAK